jgi:hypothetical protein
VWRELLLAAVSGEATALERARLRGVTLLAAEVRAATPAALPPVAAARTSDVLRPAPRSPHGGNDPAGAPLATPHREHADDPR